MSDLDLKDITAVIERGRRDQQMTSAELAAQCADALRPQFSAQLEATPIPLPDMTAEVDDFSDAVAGRIMSRLKEQHAAATGTATPPAEATPQSPAPTAAPDPTSEAPQGNHE